MNRIHRESADGLAAVQDGTMALAADAPGIGAILAAPSGRPFVIAQLGQSLDGRIATPTGASRWINGPAALDHLHRLRAAVDAVVVGANTIRTDDPQLNVRRVKGRDPVRVIIDPDGLVPMSARCLNDASADRLVICSDDRRFPDGVQSVRLDRIGPRYDPAAIVAALQSRGLHKLLIEGGASTVSAFLDAGVLDRLHLLVAPMILGSGVMGLSLQPIAGLDEAHRPRIGVHILDDDNVLFDCDFRSSTGG